MKKRKHDLVERIYKTMRDATNDLAGPVTEDWEYKSMCELEALCKCIVGVMSRMAIFKKADHEGFILFVNEICESIKEDLLRDSRFMNALNELKEGK